MNDHKKVYLTLIFLLTLASVILMVVGFATEHWIISHPVKNQTANLSDETSTKFTGVITLGLFKGHRSLDYGYGSRSRDLWVVCDAGFGSCIFCNESSTKTQNIILDTAIARYKNSSSVKELNDLGLFNFGLWVSTIVMLSLGIVWGMVAIGFTVYNIFGKPIETVTGEMGLYLWNGLALNFSLLAVLLYVGLFINNLQVNLLPEEDILTGFSSKDKTQFDQSFYCVVGAVGGFFINIILLCVSGQKCWCSYSHAGEKEIDNGMILY
ncbi:hypothetical protein SNE40_012902 [Patella caerulea]|uniref:Clarin-3 n=1 Tax=Patella caerulea TaxID=87958 RepID=A0AAN8JNF7_PATCE